MCGGPDIPDPDPRIGQAALDQIEFAKQRYADYMAPGGDRDYMHGITDETLGILKRTDARASELQNYQLEQMRFNDERYKKVGIPFEDQLVKQVNEMDTEQYRNAQVSRALADTQTQFDNSRQQGIRSMARRGANPGSGAYAAMMADGGRAQALAMATAANKTRLASQQVGLSNKMQLYGGMKGLAGLGATSAQLALGAGGQATNAATGMSGAGSNYLAGNNAAAATQTAGFSAGITGYNGYYANQVAAAKVAADNDPMNTILGAAAGALATYGAGAMMASDRRLKTDIRPIGVLDNGLVVYSFRFKAGGPMMIGVMADEVARHVPEAYIRGGAGGGYDAVDYSKL